jgi:hypothetical protein
MQHRKCFVRVTIDTGKVLKYYQCKPLADLPNPFVLGFSLQAKGQTDPYHVMVAADAAINCTCPSWNGPEKCKHTEALIAAGLLPVALIQLLRSRSDLLDQAEAECKRIAEVAMGEQVVHQHDMREAQEQLLDAQNQLRTVEARAVQLQEALAAVPVRRPRRRKAVAA